MAWGSWEYGGGNGMRVGSSVTRTSVKYNSSSVKFTIKWYTENQYTYGDGQQLDFTRGYTGTKSFYNGQGPGKKYRTTTYVTYYYSDYGKAHNSYIKARVPYTYNGVTPSQTRTLRAPARPKPPKPPDPKVPKPREDPLTIGYACLGEDSDGNVRLWYIEPDGSLNWQSYTPSSLASKYSGGSTYAGNIHLIGAETVDEEDFLITPTEIRPTPQNTTDAIFLDSDVGEGGVGHHPTLGWHSIASGGSLGRYSDYVPNGNEKAWVKYADSDGSKITKGSPAGSLLVPANRFLSATLPNPPHGVTTPVIYMGLGSSQPSDSLLKNRLETITARKMLIDPSKPGGPNSPRASSTFLDTGVGSLESQFGGLGLYGNGRITVREPQAANEATSRSYVDGRTETIGWTGLTLRSGYKDYDSARTIDAKKYGDVVVLRGIVERTTSAKFADGGEVWVATIDDPRFWPERESKQYCATNSGNAQSENIIKETGRLYVRPRGIATNYIYTEMTWMVG